MKAKTRSGRWLWLGVTGLLLLWATSFLPNGGWKLVLGGALLIAGVVYLVVSDLRLEEATSEINNHKQPQKRPAKNKS